MYHSESDNITHLNGIILRGGEVEDSFTDFLDSFCKCNVYGD